MKEYKLAVEYYEQIAKESQQEYGIRMSEEMMEHYRAIRNMPVPYEKLNEILENSRDIITSKQNRKAKNRKFFATGIPIIFMILVVAVYTLLNKQGDD